MHAERGNIKMVVANVTALQKHWPVVVKRKAALTEVRVWQREIPVIRTPLPKSGCDSEWGKPVESANECGGVSFCCLTPGFAAVVFGENLLEMKWLEERRELNFPQYRRAHRRSRSTFLGAYDMKDTKSEELHNARTRTVAHDGEDATLVV